jgi:ATP-dependent exoDNAse (exonuclease V) alpha subunit
VVPTVRLTEIFRQALNSRIIVNAHRINQGEIPLAPVKGESSDFYLIEADDPEDIAAKLYAHGKSVLAHRRQPDRRAAAGVLGHAQIVEYQAEVARQTLDGGGDGVAGLRLDDADGEAA